MGKFSKPTILSLLLILWGVSFVSVWAIPHANQAKSYIKNTAGPSIHSNHLFSTLHIDTAFAQATRNIDVTITLTNNKANLTFPNITDQIDGEDVVNYPIIRTSPAGDTKRVVVPRPGFTSNTVEYDDPDTLTAGTWTYVVRAENRLGSTLASGTKSLTIGGSSTGGDPGGGTTSGGAFDISTAITPAGSNTVQLTIKRNAKTDGSIQKLEVTCNECLPPVSHSQTLDFPIVQTQTTASFAMAKAGAYTFKIVGKDSGGTNKGEVTTSPITVTLASSTGGAGASAGTTDPNANLNAACLTAEQAANASRNTTPKISTTTLFEAIGKDGTIKVFRYVISLVNLLVLFMIIALAFTNIIRFKADVFNINKVLISLILAVILANFSWLICRFMIEVSTILYHSLVDQYGVYAGGDGGAGLFVRLAGSYGLRDGVGNFSLCKAVADQGFGSSLLATIVGTVLVLIAGILILTLYLLLIARVWVVTLLIVVSPIAFVANGFPPTQSYFKKWFTMFFNWTFMAPASFLILVLAEKVASNIGQGPNLTRYILVTGMLYFAIQVPFKMGGDWMTKWGSYAGALKSATENSLRNQATAVGDLAKQGYEGEKTELKNRLKILGWRNPVGKKILQGQENVRLRRERVENQLESAKTEPKVEYRKNTKHGLKQGEKAAAAKLEAETLAADLHKQDEKNEGEARLAELRKDPIFRELDDKYHHELAALGDLMNKSTTFKDAIADKGIKGKNLELIREDFDEQAKMGNIASIDAEIYRSLDKDDREAMLDAYLAGLPVTTEYATAKREFDAAEAEETRLTPATYKTLDDQRKAAKEKRDEAMIKASEKYSFEGRAAAISVDDALKENSTEIEAAYLKSEAGRAINAKRAMWRTFIKRNETISEAELNKAFFDMIRGDHSSIADRVSRPGHFVDASDVAELAKDFFAQNINSTIYKDFVAKETKKGEMRVGISMMQPQNFVDRQRTIERYIRSLDQDVDRMTKSLDEATKKGDAAAADKHRTDIALAGQDRKQKLEDLNVQRVQQDKYLDAMKKTYGSLDRLPQHMKKFFSDTDRAGNKLPGDKWRTVEDMEWKEGRKYYDRLMGIVAPETSSRASGLATNKSVQQLLLELSGEGDDTHDQAVMQAFMERRLADGFEALGGYNKADPRDWEKPGEAHEAIIKLAGRRREGNDARAGLLNKASPAMIERMVVQLARDRFLENASQTKLKSYHAAMAGYAKTIAAGGAIDHQAIRDFMLSNENDNAIQPTMSAYNRARNYTNLAQDY